MASLYVYDAWDSLSELEFVRCNVHLYRDLGAAHEAGYLMGLNDAYALRTSGLGFGIMGGDQGTCPSDKEVQEIIGRFDYKR